MKGYKATYNMKCLGFKYEVGKTYELEGELKMCGNGFHFCQNQRDVLNYYTLQNGFILLEVEALGKVITDGDKSVTNKIRVLRVVPKEEWEFLEGGKVLHVIQDSYVEPCEMWYTYDEDFNLIHYKSTTGREYSYEYDSSNRPIHYKSFDSRLGDKEWWRKYDANGQLAGIKYSWGAEYRYDSRGICVYKKYPNGEEVYC